MKKLKNKFFYWLYTYSKRYCIHNGVLADKINFIKVNTKDVITLTVNREAPVYDNDFDNIRENNRNIIALEIMGMIRKYIRFDHNPNDIDNNFILKTTGKIKLIINNK